MKTSKLPAPGPKAAAATAAGPALPYLADDRAGPPELVEAIRSRRGGTLLNLDRMLLHSPGLARGWNAMLGAVRGQLSLAPRLRELAVLAVAALNGAAYEWAQHEKPYLAAGGTAAQLARLRNVAAASKDAKLFDEAERAALALTLEMTRSVKVREGTLKRIRARLPDAQVVELIGAVAAYNMVSRFIVATGVELEGPPAHP